MPAAVRLLEDYSAEELRGLARRSKAVNQSRRLLSLAAVRDGMDRAMDLVTQALAVHAPDLRRSERRAWGLRSSCRGGPPDLTR